MSDYLGKLALIANQAESGDFETITNSYLELIRIWPTQKEAYIAMSLYVAKNENLQIAINILEKALIACHEHSEIYFYMARIFQENLLHHDAIDAYVKCLAQCPNYPRAHFYMATSQLALGYIESGAKNYRFREFPSELDIFSTITKWDGSDIPANILIWAEQGIGDEIMFYRLLPYLKRYCGSFTIQCDPRLVSLFQYNFPYYKFIPRNQTIVNLENYDRQLPSGDLFCLFHSALSYTEILNSVLNVPSRIHRQDIFSAKSTKQRIGISWLSINVESGLRRSINISSILDVLSISEHEIVNLQYLTPAEEINQIKSRGFKLFDEFDCFNNIEDLAYAISNCDLVISIDNSTLHLAGSLGTKTIALISNESNWRWVTGSSTTYWYKNVLMLRQQKSGDWKLPLSQLKDLI